MRAAKSCVHVRVLLLLSAWCAMVMIAMIAMIACHLPPDHRQELELQVEHFLQSQHVQDQSVTGNQRAYSGACWLPLETGLVHWSEGTPLLSQPFCPARNPLLSLASVRVHLSVPPNDRLTSRRQMPGRALGIEFKI
jgi:hypothetical protein